MEYELLTAGWRASDVKVTKGPDNRCPPLTHYRKSVLAVLVLVVLLCTTMMASYAAHKSMAEDLEMPATLLDDTFEAAIQGELKHLVADPTLLVIPLERMDSVQTNLRNHSTSHSSEQAAEGQPSTNQSSENTDVVNLSADEITEEKDLEGFIFKGSKVGNISLVLSTEQNDGESLTTTPIAEQEIKESSTANVLSEHIDQVESDFTNQIIEQSDNISSNANSERREFENLTTAQTSESMNSQYIATSLEPRDIQNHPKVVESQDGNRNETNTITSDSRPRFSEDINPDDHYGVDPEHLEELSITTTAGSAKDTSCSTIQGEHCVFPVVYGGFVWKRCIPNGNGAWCPTSLTVDHQYNTWDYCDPNNCHLMHQYNKKFH